MTPEEAIEILANCLPQAPRYWFMGKQMSIRDEARMFAKAGRYSYEYYEQQIAQGRDTDRQRFEQAQAAFTILCEAIKQ